MKKDWSEQEGEPDTDLALQSRDPRHYEAFNVYKREYFEKLEAKIDNPVSNTGFRDMWKDKVLLEVRKTQEYLESEPEVMKLLYEMDFDLKKDLETLAFELCNGNQEEFKKIKSKYEDAFTKLKQTNLYKVN